MVFRDQTTSQNALIDLGSPNLLTFVPSIFAVADGVMRVSRVHQNSI